MICKHAGDIRSEEVDAAPGTVGSLATLSSGRGPRALRIKLCRCISMRGSLHGDVELLLNIIYLRGRKLLKEKTNTLRCAEF